MGHIKMNRIRIKFQKNGGVRALVDFYAWNIWFFSSHDVRLIKMMLVSFFCRLFHICTFSFTWSRMVVVVVIVIAFFKIFFSFFLEIFLSLDAASPMCFNSIYDWISRLIFFSVFFVCLLFFQSFFTHSFSLYIGSNFVVVY